MRWSRVAVLLIALHAASAAAIEPFVIRDIRVEGIQRTEAGTVFGYLPVKVGDTMTEQKAAQAIRALFATGFFQDVTIERDGNILVVSLRERPSIAQIDFVGTRELKNEQLMAGMRQIGLAEGRIFDRGVLERAEQELKRLYLSQGYYAIKVDTTVTPLERNRVSLNFNVEEGQIAKIRQIKIIGAKSFSEKDLLKQFVLTTPGMMTWYTKNDQYSRQKLSADLETLRSYYLDRGYAEFVVDSTQVSITPDKQDIFITINVTEGPKYTVADVKVAGQLLIPEAEVRKLIKVNPGDVFSRARLTESSKLITDRLSNDGYAFANVNAVPELNRQKQQVGFTFLIDPGRRVYVRRVNISGNTRTRDEVIRREMRQLEGAWYSAEKISLSRQRIDKLGYFQQVNVETPAVQGANDQVDLDVAVVEKPTGRLLFGAGFGSSEGLVLSGSVAQENIFGSGRHVNIGVNTSKINTTYALGYTNPYSTVDGVSRGFDIYYRKLDAADNSLGRYKTTTAGGVVRLGVPLTEFDSIRYGLGYDDTKIELFDNSPLIYKDYVETFGSNPNNVFINVNWQRDRRDSLIYPTEGAFHQASGEVGLPVADLEYYKLSYRYQRYFPLTQAFTVMLNGEIGYGDGYGSAPLPFFKNFYTGGVSSVRGFKAYTIGPKDSNGDPRGGSRKLVGNVEFLFPFPGLGNDRSVRLSAFVDAGMVDDKWDTQFLRYSIGLAGLWVSPFGPLKISAAVPFRSDPLDREEPFQFTFGGVF
ncbi:MAG: outer membrane protein assembly factor BamA [Betaproteobacteria bacterium]|nr:MAG: outer membrane protein assembly factor BamA [Betaproteobacteria bacterium]